jgi:CBS domain-containing protein
MVHPSLLKVTMQAGRNCAMLENVIVRDWMNSPVISVAPATLISDAHQLMKDRGVRRLVVLEHGKMVGIVTVGDIREASPSAATSLSIWELNYLWSRITVEEIMTKDVLTIKLNRSVLDAAEMMMEYKVGGLPVVDEKDQVVGIITESDIFKMLVSTRAKAQAIQ